MTAPFSPRNAPTGPKDPPQNNRQCSQCGDFLQADDSDLCKRCQALSQAKTEIPVEPRRTARKYDKWDELLDKGDQLTPIRRALQATRRRMPDATRLEVARAREAEWDERIDREVRTAVRNDGYVVPDQPAIFMEDLRRIIAELQREEDEEENKSKKGTDKQETKGK